MYLLYACLMRDVVSLNEFVPPSGIDLTKLIQPIRADDSDEAHAESVVRGLFPLLRRVPLTLSDLLEKLELGMRYHCVLSPDHLAPLHRNCSDTDIYHEGTLIGYKIPVSESLYREIELGNEEPDDSAVVDVRESSKRATQDTLELDLIDLDHVDESDSAPLPDVPEPPGADHLGIFPAQRDLAGVLLTRIRSFYGGSLARFNKISFRVGTANYLTLEQQTNDRLRKARLTPHDIIHRYDTSNNPKMKQLEAKASPRTLFVLIADECHWGIKNEGANHCFVNSLLDQENVIVLLVSATPYAVLTCRSRVLPANIVDWSDSLLAFHPLTLHATTCLADLQQRIRNVARRIVLRHFKSDAVLVVSPRADSVVCVDETEPMGGTFDWEHAWLFVTLPSDASSDHTRVMLFACDQNGTPDRVLQSHSDTHSLRISQLTAALTARPDHLFTVHRVPGYGMVSLSAGSLFFSVTADDTVPARLHLTHDRSRNRLSEHFFIDDAPVSPNTPLYRSLTFYLNSMRYPEPHRRLFRTDPLLTRLASHATGKSKSMQAHMCDYALSVVVNSVLESRIDFYPDLSLAFGQTILQDCRDFWFGCHNAMRKIWSTLVDSVPDSIRSLIRLFPRHYATHLAESDSHATRMQLVKHCFALEDFDTVANAIDLLWSWLRERPRLTESFWRFDTRLETERVVADLTIEHGKMALVRVEDIPMGKQMWQMVRKARDLVGWQRRFLLLCDFGGMSLDTMFRREEGRNMACNYWNHRLQCGRACDTCDQCATPQLPSTFHVTCTDCGHVHRPIREYSHLQGIPTLLLVVEKGRLGDTFPVSLSTMDLRSRYSATPSSLSSVVQDLGRVCRYAPSSTPNASLLVGNGLFGPCHRKRDRAASFEAIISSPDTTMTRIAGQRVDTTTHMWSHFEPVRGNKSYDGQNAAGEVHTRRLVLQAAPQIGKTGTYASLLVQLKSEVEGEAATDGVTAQRECERCAVIAPRITLSPGVSFVRDDWFFPIASTVLDRERFDWSVSASKYDGILSEPFTPDFVFSPTQLERFSGQNVTVALPPKVVPLTELSVRESEELYRFRTAAAVVRGPVEGKHQVLEVEGFQSPLWIPKAFEDVFELEQGRVVGVGRQSNSRLLRSWVFVPSVRLDGRHDWSRALGVDETAIVRVVVVRAEQYQGFVARVGHVALVLQLPETVEHETGLCDVSRGVGYARLVCQRVAHYFSLKTMFLCDDNIDHLAAVTGDRISPHSPVLAVEPVSFFDVLAHLERQLLGEEPDVPYRYESTFNMTVPERAGKAERYGMLGIFRQNGHHVATSSFRRTYVYSLVLVHVSACVARNVWFRPWPFREDLKFAADCERAGLAVLKYQAFVQVKLQRRGGALVRGLRMENAPSPDEMRALKSGVPDATLDRTQLVEIIERCGVPFVDLTHWSLAERVPTQAQVDMAALTNMPQWALFLRPVNTLDLASVYRTMACTRACYANRVTRVVINAAALRDCSWTVDDVTPYYAGVLGMRGVPRVVWWRIGRGLRFVMVDLEEDDVIEVVDDLQDADGDVVMVSQTVGTKKRPSGSSDGQGKEKERTKRARVAAVPVTTVTATTSLASTTPPSKPAKTSTGVKAAATRPVTVAPASRLAPPVVPVLAASAATASTLAQAHSAPQWPVTAASAATPRPTSITHPSLVIQSTLRPPVSTASAASDFTRAQAHSAPQSLASTSSAVTARPTSVAHLSHLDTQSIPWPPNSAASAATRAPAVPHASRLVTESVPRSSLASTVVSPSGVIHRRFGNQNAALAHAAFLRMGRTQPTSSVLLKSTVPEPAKAKASTKKATSEPKKKPLTPTERLQRVVKYLRREKQAPRTRAGQGEHVMQEEERETSNHIKALQKYFTQREEALDGRLEKLVTDCDGLLEKYKRRKAIRIRRVVEVEEEEDKAVWFPPRFGVGGLARLLEHGAMSEEESEEDDEEKDEDEEDDDEDDDEEEDDDEDEEDEEEDGVGNGMLSDLFCPSQQFLDRRPFFRRKKDKSIWGSRRKHR